MTGPTIQPKLSDAIIRFRQYNVAFCVDIKKMYRQVIVHPRDRRFQHIIWRADPANHTIQHY